MKKVYLTIDDSPSENFMSKIIFLKNKNIPAIIFCIGRLIEKNEKDIIEAIRKDFVIGNHSYSHNRFSEISMERGYEEIKRTDKIIERCYKKSGRKRPAKLFRFPYGDKGDGFNPLSKNKKRFYQECLKKLGYEQPDFRNIKYNYWIKNNLKKEHDIFWTYDFEEYNLPLDRVFRDMNKKLKSKSNDIVLLHDHKETEKEFYLIIENLIKNKIKFIMPDFD